MENSECCVMRNFVIYGTSKFVRIVKSRKLQLDWTYTLVKGTRNLCTKHGEFFLEGSCIENK
jgi:hypothetical protein